MQKRSNCIPVTPEASLPYTELFGSLSPVYEEEIEEEWLEGKTDETTTFWSFKSSDHSVLDAWELLQEYGDLNCNSDDFPELYDVCVNINDVCCKSEGQKKGIPGPTLAELNERRALSPLINPEMRRLHMEATEFEEPDFFLSGMLVKDQNTAFEPSKNPPKVSVPVNFRNATPIILSNDSQSSNIRCPVLGEKPKDVEMTTRTCCSEQKTDSGGGEWEKGTDMTVKAEASEEEAECSDSDNSSVDKDSELSPRTEPVDDHLKVSGESEEMDAPMDSDMEDDEDDDDDLDSEDEHDSKRVKILMAKGRRSEAEDWTPNPAKLVEIGKQLDRLNRVIGDLRPINQLPVNSRNKTRREKNKLASRACRLKKKAGHEANKIKLRGLEMENELLRHVMQTLKEALTNVKESPKDHIILKNVDLALGNCVAGKLKDFVETVIKKAASGDVIKGFKPLVFLDSP